MAMPPKAEDVAVMEESNAKETLQEFPRAAGAYDRMPFASAAAVWTLDTSTDIFLLHSFQVRCASLSSMLKKCIPCVPHHSSAEHAARSCKQQDDQRAWVQPEYFRVLPSGSQCMVHVMQAQPLSGGQLLGNGRMWVSPSGEVDPRAVKVRFEGRNLPTETLLKRYLPKVSRSPSSGWGCLERA